MNEDPKDPKRMKARLPVRAGVAVALLAGAVGVLHTRFAARWVVQELMSKADAEGIAVSMSGLHYNLISGHVQIDHLVLRVKSSPNAFFAARTVKGRVSYLHLGSGLAALSQVSVADGTFRMQVDRSGHSNLDFGSTVGSAAPKGFPSRVSLRGMHFLYEDGTTYVDQSNLNLEFRDGHWTGHSAAPGYVHAAATKGVIASFQMNGEERGVTLRDIRLHVLAEATRVQFGDGSPAILHVSADLLGSDNAIAFTQVEARSSKGVLVAHGLLPFDDMTGSVAFAGRYDAVAVNGTAEWAGTNYETYAGRADVRSYRNDLRGEASVRFNAKEVQARIRRVSGYGIHATGTATLKIANSALSGKLQGAAPDLRGMTGAKVSGHVDFLASLGGTLKAPSVTVAASSPDLGVASLQSIHASARAHYHSGRVQITDTQAGWQGQVVHAAGEVLVTHNPRIALTVHSESLDARVLTSSLLSTPIEGRVDVNGSVTGALASPVAKLLVQAQGLSAHSESLGDLVANVAFDNKKLLLQNARLHKNSGDKVGLFQADGSYDLASEELAANLSATAFPLEGSFIVPNFKHPLVLTGTGQLHGKVETLSGDASLTLRDDHGAEVHANVRAVDGNANASLGSSDLDIALPDGTARGTVAVEARGALSDLERATASATVRNFSFQTATTTVSANEPIQVLWQNQGLDVVRAMFHDGSGNLELQGRLALQPSSDHLVVQGRAPVGLVTAFRPDVANFHPEGTLRLDASVGGSILAPRFAGSLYLNSGSLQVPGTEEAFRDLEGHIVFNGQSVELQGLAAKLGTGTLSLTGHADSLHGPFESAVTVSGVDPTLLFKIRLPQLTAKVSGTATLSGATTTSLDDLEGSAQFTELELESSAGNASQAKPITASLRNGLLRVDQSSFISKYGRVQTAGTFDMHEPHAITGSLDGVIDTSFLNLYPDLRLSGPLNANVTVSGTTDAPDVRGEAALHGGAARLLRPLRLDADRIDLHAELEGSSLRIDRMSMDVNGGSVRGSGAVSLGAGLQHGKFDWVGEDVFLNYPEGLTSASDFDLHLALGGTTPELTGKITVNDSAYRQALDITRLSRPSPADAGVASDTFASKLRLDVAVETDQPLTIDNNLGRLNADANLHLQGTLLQPGVTGGLQLEDGGQVNFAGRNFRIDQGRVDFTSANRIEPRFNLQAESTIGSYLVTLKVNGDEKNLDTSFQSEPSLPQDQILSLLFTGSPDNGNNSSYYAQSQLVSLLGSTVGGSFFTTVRNTLRLNEFRIDPRLIAADQNPTARLTVGEAFTPSFRMTYSTDLTNAQDQVWTAEYDWRKRFLARFYRDSDQSNRAEIRQKFRFGGGLLTGDYAQHPALRKLVVRNVLIEGEPIFDQDAIRKRLHLKVGTKYDTFRSQRDVARLRAFYVKHGYAEVRVHSHRVVEGDSVSLSYDIDAGPPIVFRYESNVDSHTRKAIIAKWQEGLTDDQRTSDIQQLLQESLKARRYPSAESNVEVHEAQGKKVVLIDVRPGQRYEHPEIAMPGIAKGEQSKLRAIARRSNTDIQGELHPESLTQKLTTQLHADGYLAAAVDATVEHAAPAAGSLRITGTTGPHFVLGSVTIEGNTRLKTEVLRSSLSIESGDAFREDVMQVVATRVQQTYWDAGFRDARVTCNQQRDNIAGKVNLVVSVAEGPESTLGSLAIAGLSETNEAFLRRRLTFKLNAPLAGSAVSQSRRNLLDSGAYNMVDFTFKPAAQTSTDPARRPSDLLITVREPKPYRLDFGATYDTDRGFGGIADVSVVNKLGEARTLGFRLTADSQAQDYRVYFSQPFLGRKRIISTASLFAQHEQISIFDGYDQGLALQHDLRFRKTWNTTYGYQFEHVTVDVKNLGELFNETKSNIVATLSRDSRDKPLDAAKGTFFSAASEYGPHQLGGSIGYFRAYAQASAYVGLLHPRPLPFEETRRRSRLVFATNARAGVVNNIGDALLIPTDLFFAGGGTSIRGFSQNSVGPVDSSGSAVGGKVTVIFNNELRFPLYKFVDGVAFVDNGNVWKQPDDVRFTDLKTGAGAGLRVRNPFVLIRLDYGLKVNRQPGDSRGAFFFSIGQTF